MIPVTFFSAILISPAVYLLYGTEYLPLISPFLIMLVGVAFSSVTGTLVMYFMGVGRPGVLVYTLFLPIIVQIAIGYWAVKNYGINGAAAILSMSMILVGCAQTFLFLKHTDMKFSKNLIFTKTDLLTVVNFSKRIIYYKS